MHLPQYPLHVYGVCPPLVRDSTLYIAGPDLILLRPGQRDDRKPVLPGPGNAVGEKWTDAAGVGHAAQGDFAGAAGVCGV